MISIRCLPCLILLSLFGCAQSSVDVSGTGGSNATGGNNGTGGTATGTGGNTGTGGGNTGTGGSNPSTGGNTGTGVAVTAGALDGSMTAGAASSV